MQLYIIQQTVEVLYISTQGRVQGRRLLCFYVVSWCTLSRVRGRRLVCFYVVCLLVYSEQWVWGKLVRFTWFLFWCSEKSIPKKDYF